MLVASLWFGIRRIKANLWSFVAVVVALGAAGALIGWASVRAAEAQEQSVQRRLQALTPTQRAFRVVYYTLPFEGDVRRPRVMSAMRSFADIGERLRRVRIWHSLERGNPLGTRLVVVSDVRDDVIVREGRRPSRCETGVCEAVSLTGSQPIGARVRLASGAAVVVVGRGSLRAGLVPDHSDLGARALLVNGISRPLFTVASPHGSTVVTTSLLDPRRVHGYALGSLRKRLRTTIAGLEFGDDLLRATAPFAVFDDLTERGAVARNRLLIVAGECAALIVVFGAFVATMRRREVETVDEQLTNLGATRTQIWTARFVEYVTPGLLGATLALVGTWATGRVVASVHRYPSAFAHAALTWPTMLLISAAGLCGALLLAVSVQHRRSVRGFGAVELAAVAALGVLVWQASTTGALQPEDVARGSAAPVVLLAPALAFFTAAIVLVRAVPTFLRIAERTARRAPLARLAIISAARDPGSSAVATTFLSVVLGGSLFSFGYLATIDRQTRDAAEFAVGARWRLVGPSLNGAHAIRLDGAVPTAAGADLAVRVLALPAVRIPGVLGWRRSFSPIDRRDIAQRIRPTRIKLTGPPLAHDATALRVYARSRTDFPRRIVLHFLLPGQHFGELSLGTVWRRWQLLHADVPPRLRGAELVGLGYEATKTPISFKYDPEGIVDLGPIEEHTGAGWAALGSLAAWNATTLPTGTAGLVYAQRFRGAPVARGLRFEVNGTRRPLIHPAAGLPTPLPGFSTGALPALVAPRVAAQASGGLLTLVVAGKQLPVRVAATARLFPTIVDRQSSFLVFDYDTLFAALNADQPGIATPTESWFFGGRAPPHPTLDVRRRDQMLRNDPLAAGTRTVLAATAAIAALLALIGLALAARTATTSERPVLAEYEALGAPPSSLRGAAQLRLLLLSTVGIAAGALAALVGTRLIAALVAVTANAGRPLPPIVTVVPWAADAVVIAAVSIAALVAAALIVRGVLRGPPARRLRA